MSTKKKAPAPKRSHHKPEVKLPPLKAADQPPKPPRTPDEPQPVPVLHQPLPAPTLYPLKVDGPEKLISDLSLVLSEDSSPVFILEHPETLSDLAVLIRNRLSHYRDQIRWFRTQK